MPTSTNEHAAEGTRASAISKLVGGLLSDYTGRGPTRVRTHVNEIMVTVLLEDTLTKGERSLVKDGNHELVLANRKAYQRTMRDDLIAGIEEILGRRVRAFMSDNHIEPDLAVEVFVLEPVQ